MNDEKFAILISTYPDDSVLQSDLTQYYVHPSTPKKDEDAFYKGFAYQLKSWIQWKVFLLVITLGFYAIHYLRINFKQANRNIFSVIREVSKKHKALLDPDARKPPTVERKNSYSEILEASHDPDKPSKEKPQDAIEREETAEPEKSEDIENPNFSNPEALKTIINHDNGISFPENIRNCFRLQNGNFVVQGFNNKVWIITEKGEHVKDLATKKIEELAIKIEYKAGPKTITTPIISKDNLAAEITHFAQLEDGSIVGAGETIETNTPIVFIWKDDELDELFLDTPGKIHSIDTFGNDIICSTTNQEANTSFVFKIQKQNGKYEAQKYKVSQHMGVVSFINDNNNFIYFEQHDNTPQKFLKSISESGELLAAQSSDLTLMLPNEYDEQTLRALPKIEHIMRVSVNQVITVANVCAIAWDVMKDEAFWGFENKVTHIACSPNKTCFAFCDETGRIFLLANPFNPHDQPIEFFSVDPIQQLFLSDDGEISVAVKAKAEEGLDVSAIKQIKFYNKMEFQNDNSSTVKL